MRILTFLVAVALILSGCGNKSNHNHTGDNLVADGNPNDVLAAQVDEIHMDAMGKMDEVIRLKTQLQEKLTQGPKRSDAEKDGLKNLINTLDSANSAMMSWMHGMNNLPDSADAEKTREFYETQLETIKKIREVTNEVIEKAKKEAN